VSGRDLDHDDRLVSAVARTLEMTGIRASDVEIELTESVAVAQHQRALAILRRLRQLRVRVAIDDFGTGYAAISRLKDFPPDRIKIDRSFIGSIGDPSQDALVAAMITMGHTIGLSVLAEGVETVEQLRFLAAHGCDEVQGYLLSRPMPARDLEELLGDPGSLATSPCWEGIGGRSLVRG
jgi:EAL domain-containing protein (putative c-di-GMP-specific phosphodiesterase class I)